MSYRGVSLGAEGVDFCAAIINAQADGSILVEIGIHENGQGSETAMVLILAEELGMCWIASAIVAPRPRSSPTAVRRLRPAARSWVAAR